ncbi:phosphoribosyltransferase family protein [Streptomyces sp. NBC_01571]|uniref:phosphoribosyltransferase family protein n=1 Tax=Streptomyces sp. NBC_01571 TaxID=2975883 RepID=UPI0022566992|nr:phosphoribosyltransferase family protein [Streptomyces sp. NBC_01571]MCX4581153.1 phosphoribosyltransferase family protein [Streptomyces sp. NBC_01571]
MSDPRLPADSAPVPVPVCDLVFSAADGRRARMVSWRAYQVMAADVAAQIRAQHPGPLTLVGVLQGGWITAQSLADLLPGSLVLAAAARHHGGRTDGISLFAATDGLLTPATPPAGQPVVVVDEVVDSGRTARYYLSQLAPYSPQLACLATSDRADPAPQFAARTMSDLPALVLPWRVLRDFDQTAACLLAAGPLTTKQIDERLRELGHDLGPDLLEPHLAELARRGRLHHRGFHWHRL